MILFNVLNEDTTPIDLTINTDKELHVEELLVQYTNAISEENAEIRKNKLEIILKHEFLMERLDSIGNIQDSPIHTLQYCVFKNFASLLNDKEALIYYKKAVTLDPTAIDLLLKIAAIYEREGYLSSAYRYYVKCLDFDLIDQQQKSIMIKVALILFKYGLFADAMAWANKVLQMDSQDLTCLAIKAYIVEECYQSQSQIRLFDLNMNQIEIIRFQKNKEMIPTLERPILNGNQAIIPLKSKPINVKLDTTLSVLSLELLKLMIHVFHFTNDNDDNEKPENGVIHVKLVQNQDGSADMDCSSSNPDIEKLDIISIASSSDIAESQTQNANSKKLSNPLKVPDAKMEITNDALTANATKENDATLELDKVVKLEIDENGEPIDSVIDSIKLEDDGEGIQSVSKKRKLSIAGEEKRSSNRVKKLLMADETPEVVEPISYSVFENLLELNSILPDDKQFTEFGSNIKSFIKDPEGLIQRISKELVSKASTKKQTQQSHFQIQYSAWMQTQNEQHPFFNSTDLCEEFCSNLITSVGTLPNILFELIKFLIESSIVSKRWCASLSYISYTIIQITNQLSDSLATYISSISDSKNDDWEVLMIITEILFESLLDHTGKNYLEESNDELNGLDTINPLNKSSKKALFNKCLVKLNYIVQSNECDVLFLIRFYWLLTKQEEQFGIALKAVEALRNVKSLYNQRPQIVPITLLFCQFENIISDESIRTKIDYQQLRLHIDETKYLIHENEVKIVVERLQPLLLGVDHQQKGAGFDIISKMPISRRLELLQLLKMSSKSMKLYSVQFESILESIFLLMVEIDEGAVGFYINLEQYGLFLGELLELIHLGNDWESQLPLIVHEKLGSIAFQSLQICWTIVQCMPNIPTKPHSLYNKKLTLFTNICSQSWRLFYYYIKPFIKHTSEQKLDHLSEILIWAHDQLGRVGLCGGEDGAFLRLILSHVSEKDLQYSHELYQCCKCLFDTNMIANPNQILIDHKCKSANFGTEAATILFNSLRPQLIGRLDGQSIRSIPKEMKDTLDKIAILFKNPPLEHVYVKRNSKAIELLLHSDIDITLVNPNRPQHLAVYEVPAVCQDISSVCFDLYSLQGKLLLNSYYSAKQDQQSLAALKSAVEKFKFHLFVKPFDIDAWVSLGNCFLMLSYEKLGSKIAEYVDRQDISSYQKKAFHCFVRASKLEMKQRNSLSVDYQFELTNTLWGNFGLLCLSILSAPMNGIALTGSSSTVLETWNKKSKSLQENSIEASTNTDLETEKLSLEKSKKYLYGIAAFLFKRAYEKNSFSWIFMLRLAHIYRKLDRPPKKVLNAYLKAMELLPPEPSNKDQCTILDLIYKCTSYLLKSFMASKIATDLVFETIEKMVAYHNGLKEYIGTDQDDSYTKQLDSDVPPAILRIILVLEAIKKYDRKRWFHRPPFRLSWLLYHATNRNDLALEEMCQMVNLKSRVGGGFRSIWKTDLELPGRYFVYYHQYIKALLQMAVQAEDMTALIALSRRLHVEDEKLTQRHFMGTEARQALLNYFTSNTVVSDLDITRFCKHVSSCDIEVEKRMIDGNQRSTDLTNLVLSCELKKQRKSRESALDRFIANLYAKLYWAACESLFLSEQKPLPVARANPLSEDKIREKLVVRAIRLTNQIKDVEKENAGRESSNTNSNSEVVKGRMSLGSTPSQKVLL